MKTLNHIANRSIKQPKQAVLFMVCDEFVVTGKCTSRRTRKK